jgi:hypothetical protein
MLPQIGLIRHDFFETDESRAETKHRIISILSRLVRALGLLLVAEHEATMNTRLEHLVFVERDAILVKLFHAAVDPVFWVVNHHTDGLLSVGYSPTQFQH